MPIISLFLPPNLTTSLRIQTSLSLLLGALIAWHGINLMSPGRKTRAGGPLSDPQSLRR